MSETTPRPTHEVKQGQVFVEVNGTLTRNYVVLGGKRVYVHAELGAQLTKKQAEQKSTEK